jgi:hypothetical protein
LVDEFQVWATGRTVQCDECGERWRAYGQGVRPQPAVREPVGLEAFAAEARELESPPAPLPIALPASAAEKEPDFEHDRVSGPAAGEPAEGVSARDVARSDEAWMTPAPTRFPVVDAPEAVSESPMAEPPMFRRAAGREPEPSVFAAGGLRLALIILLVIATFVGGLILLREPLVRFQPALAPVFSAMGMPVRAARAAPAAPPHAPPKPAPSVSAPAPRATIPVTHAKPKVKHAVSKPAAPDE